MSNQGKARGGTAPRRRAAIRLPGRPPPASALAPAGFAQRIEHYVLFAPREYLRYPARHAAERGRGGLKQGRRVATRYAADARAAWLFRTWRVLGAG